MNSLSHAYLDALRFSAEELSTLRQLGEYRGRQELFTRQRPEVLRALRQVAVVESNESSNRLEGITVPHEQLRRIVLENTRPRNRDEQEVAGYRDALQLIHESTTDMPFSVGVIQQLHGMLYRYHPSEGGRWKMTDNEIVEHLPHGGHRVRFRPVSAVATPQAMEDLVTLYRRASEEQRQDPLVLAPLTILDFLCIHPFRDGNGRSARLLTVLLLYHHGYEVGRYISLERIFEQAREGYYATLEESSQGWHEGRHDPHPWLGHFWGVLLRAYREFEERVGDVERRKGSKSERVRRAVLRRTLPFRVGEIERDCPGVSRETIRLVLRQLRDEGHIVAEGKGRATRWRRLTD